MDLFGTKKRAVAALDLSRVTSKAAERHNWTTQEAQTAEDDYRRFLYLLMKYPGQTFVPWTQELDLLWHEHILDTRRYATDCQRLFGRFIHHDPHVRQTPRAELQAKQKTAYLFNYEFNQPLGSDPKMAWLAASVATLALVALMHAEAEAGARHLQQEEEARHQQQPSPTPAQSSSSGCGTTPIFAGDSAPTMAPAAPAASCASGTSSGASCGGGGGGGGCGGGGGGGAG